jgi:hypothetical protein
MTNLTLLKLSLGKPENIIKVTKKDGCVRLKKHPSNL